jgi:hypothetical protein
MPSVTTNSSNNNQNTRRSLSHNPTETERLNSTLNPSKDEFILGVADRHHSRLIDGALARLAPYSWLRRVIVTTGNLR